MRRDPFNGLIRGIPWRFDKSTQFQNATLVTAISYCHKRVEEIADKSDTETAKSYFFKLVKFIRDAVCVVRLTVPNEVNAFRVFETLNDRGLDLSAVDLIKNHLFGLAHGKSDLLLQQIENRWSQLTHQLREVSVSDFLRVYWTSRYGRTQLDDLFDKVRESVKTCEAAGILTIDLLDAADHYVALDSPDDPVWSPYSQKTRDKIRSLRILNSRPVRPVILSAVNKLPVLEFQKLIWLLEVVVVRWQIIGGRRTGAIEIACARLVHRFISMATYIRRPYRVAQGGREGDFW